MSDSLPPHEPASLLCPWDFPGKNTRVGCHSLFQGIFPTQRSNPHLHWQADSLPQSYLGSPVLIISPFNSQVWLHTKNSWILEDDSGLWQNQTVVSTAAAMPDVVSLLGEISTALYMAWTQWSAQWAQSGVHSCGTDNGVHLRSWSRLTLSLPLFVMCNLKVPRKWGYSTHHIGSLY